MVQTLNLDDYRWQNRLLFLFAPDAKDEDYIKQLEALDANKRGLGERDLILFRVVGKEAQQDTFTLAAGSADSLRKKFEVTGTFTLILVGKDGGVKRREETTVAVDDLFTQIDSMPMRQQEMRDD